MKKRLPSLERLSLALRESNLRSLDLVEAAIEARDLSPDPLGPFLSYDPDRARRQAEAADAAFEAGMVAGPLQGIPVSIKDLFGVPGWPTYAGTLEPLPSLWEEQGPVVQAITSQLAVVMGKTHMVELAFGGLGTNRHWGTPRNPWDPKNHRVPGGSSTGAGISILEGSALLALGTDTAGSVRIPAGMTGIVGLKTSIGRWPTGGILPLSSTLDTVGILTRTVEDAGFAFQAIESSLFGTSKKLTPRPITSLRLGVPNTFYWENLSPGIEEVLKQAISELESKGATIVPLELEESHEAYDIFLQGGLAGIEVADLLSRQLPDRMQQLDPAVRDRIQASETMTAKEYLRRRARFASLSQSASARLENVDALLTPTVAISPPMVSELEDLDTYRRCNLLSLRNTSIANLLSLCALSLPVGLDALGLPVGLQLMASQSKDVALLELGLALEHALGTASRRLSFPPS